MMRPRPRIGFELLPVVLILCCLVGTWSLVIRMHRRATSVREPKAAETPVIAAAPPAGRVVTPPAPSPLPEPEPEAEPEAEPAPPPPPEEDPTRLALARIGAEEAAQRLEAQAADRKAEALEKARQATVAESQRHRRREMLVRGQLEALAARARQLEQEADELALERDVLARERDAAKAALVKARNRASSYAVLPTKAPNGTWRRPIILECRNGTVKLQPNGPTFTLLDLSMLLGGRSSPLLNAVVRELIRTQGLSTPDGAPAVPYIFFVVRPDGIRPYYEARGRLEPLGIAFGYELVDQDMEIEYPDLDNLEEWDGSAPLPSFPRVAGTHDAPQPSRANPMLHDLQGDTDDSFIWPTRPPGAGLSPGPGVSGFGGPPDAPRGDQFGHEPPGGPGEGIDPRGGFPPGIPGADPSDEPFPSSGRPGPDSPDAPGLAPPGLESEPATGGRPDLVTISPDRLPGLEEAPAGPERAGAPPTSPGGSWTAPRNDAPARPQRSGGIPTYPGASQAAQDRGIPAFPGGSQATAADAQHGGSSTPDGGQPKSTVSRWAAQPGAHPPLAESISQGRRDFAPKPGSLASRVAGLLQENDEAHPGRMRVPLGGSGTSLTAGEGSSGGIGLDDASGLEHELGGSSGTGVASLDRPKRIEVPMEILVSCGRNGVVIHPGGYRISTQALKGKDGMLAKELKSIVRLRQQVDPLILPRPTIKFLVEPGGNETYWDARRQTVLSGLDWPTSLQVADTEVLDFFPGRRF